MRDDSRVLRQHPLAYLLGLEGVALLRAYAGEHDAAFVEARLAEVRALLDAGLEPADLPRLPVEAAYDAWAGSYDEPGNDLVEVEQAVVWEILDGLPPGLALDAACGTGRHAARLAALGHRVIGVDASPGMLERARAKVPDGDFRLGDLHRLPLPDDHVDLVVCGLALMHVPALEPAYEELVRVLRPGGDLVVSDWRGLVGTIAMPLRGRGPGGELGHVEAWCRHTSDHLRAALPLGLRLLRCEEPLRPWPVVADGGPAPEPAGAAPSIWELQPLVPDAANAAYRDNRIALVLHFRLDG